MSITEDLGGPGTGRLKSRAHTRPRIAEALAERGFGSREALAAQVALVGLLVLAAPAVRWLVPIGAPGSRLPDWIVGPLSPLAGNRLPGGPPVGWAILLLITLSWLIVLTDCESLALKPVMWSIGIIYGLLLIAPPLLSTDVFTYLSAGRLQVLHGVNPYLHGPVVRPQDPVFAWTGLVWCDTPTVYGPAFSLLSAGLAGFGLAFGLWSMKLIAALSAVACAALVWSIAKRLGRPAMTAMIFVALNPVLLAHGIGGAHNDLMMLAAVLFAVRLVIDAKPVHAGAVLAGAMAIKPTAGLVLPFLIIGAREYALRGGRRCAAGFAGAGAVLAGIGFAIYGFSWLAVPITISRGPARQVGVLESIPGMFAGYLRLGTIGPVASAVLVSAAVVAIALAVRFALAREGRWITAAAIGVMTTLAFATQLHAWYILLALPFAALSPDARVRKAAVAMTVTVLLVIPAIRGILPIGVTWPYKG